MCLFHPSALQFHNILAVIDERLPIDVIYFRFLITVAFFMLVCSVHALIILPALIESSSQIFYFILFILVVIGERLQL
jgi:hypothetical protein